MAWIVLNDLFTYFLKTSHFPSGTTGLNSRSEVKL